MSEFSPIHWHNGRFQLLDQTKKVLVGQFVWLLLTTTAAFFVDWRVGGRGVVSRVDHDVGHTEVVLFRTDTLLFLLFWYQKRVLFALFPPFPACFFGQNAAQKGPVLG